jgi:hypothetical protein
LYGLAHFVTLPPMLCTPGLRKRPRSARLFFHAALPLAALCCLAFRAHANDPAKEAAAMLARSREQMDIRATGPFRLRAEVELTQRDDKPVKGTFTLVWAAPDRYRCDFAFPGSSETTIVSGATIWRKRATAAPYRCTPGK